MVVFFVTLAVFALAIGAMAVGAIVTGRRLQGSCGGVSSGACACGPEKQKKCKETRVAHADVPIAPSALTRSSPQER